jgi:hypothetical protein
MVTYERLQADRRQFLALTGLTRPEFRRLLSSFPRAYQRLYPASRTTEGRPRQRAAGGGRRGRLRRPEDRLLFIRVYLKTYPLQAVMGELFGLSQPRVNSWIHRLLPVLRGALDDLGACPEREAAHFARSQAASGAEPRLIIDGTERRRQRPKGPGKQAPHSSGQKRAPTDKDVVIVTPPRKRVDSLSPTCAGKAPDKKVADTEGITYPPEATLSKDTGSQGYNPAVKEAHQAKKRAAPRRTHRG